MNNAFISYEKRLREMDEEWREMKAANAAHLRKLRRKQLRRKKRT